jgi:hypothetical protein
MRWSSRRLASAAGRDRREPSGRRVLAIRRAPAPLLNAVFDRCSGERRHPMERATSEAWPCWPRQRCLAMHYSGACEARALPGFGLFGRGARPHERSSSPMERRRRATLYRPGRAQRSATFGREGARWRRGASASSRALLRSLRPSGFVVEVGCGSEGSWSVGHCRTKRWSGRGPRRLRHRSFAAALAAQRSVRRT